MSYCYFNGTVTKYEDCLLHISDLQIQRGYGVFDFFRIRNSQITWLEDYTDRLFNSIRLSGIESPLTRQDFTSVIYDLQQKNGGENAAFKVMVTGGYSDNLDQVNGNASIIILYVPWERPPVETFEKGVHLVRDQYVRPNPEIKTLYYLNSLRLHEKMKSFGAVDVLYHTGMITETSRANLFFVKGGQVFTPANNILKGITRKQVLSMFGVIRVEDIDAGRLYDFDEVFLTSTSRDVTPVVSVEGKKIGNGHTGPVTREIQAAFTTSF